MLETKLKSFVTPICAAVALAASAAPLSAAVVADNFDSDADYLATGIPGTIWDGIYLGAGEFANTANGAAGPGATVQADANIGTPNALTIRSSATAWEFTEDDGFFLYKVVAGDFSASVRIVTPYDTGSFNTAGLMARAFAPGGNPFGGSENWVSWTRFDQFNIGNYFRSAVNGGTDRRTKPPSGNYWLRLDRSGNTFTVYERANPTEAWTLMDTQVRNDLAGQPLQVGIIHATFNAERIARFSDFSLTATNMDAHAAPPQPASGLSIVAGTNRNATISWDAAAGSSGSLVAVWTGAGVLKQRPANGFAYAEDSNFGAGGRLLATNHFVVYSGSGSSVEVTNLPSGATCHAAVFSFSGSDNSTAYAATPAVGSFIASSAPVAAANNIAVDPATPLTNHVSLGSWDTEGNLDGWATAGISNATAASGILSGAASTSNPQVSRLNFAGGPNLNLGFHDFLELRIQLPAAFNGNLMIYYGVTSAPGVNASRVLTIPNSIIPKDGAFHTYRIDLGLERGWRATLRDLRIDPLGNAATPGQSFAIDYLRVGDLTGDIYLPRFSTECPAPGAANTFGRTVMSMESKHFRFLWDSTVAAHANWNANMPELTLRNLEETWQLYVNHLGYREPSESWNPGNRNGNKYKVNMITWHSGYWAGGDGNTAFGYINITPDGLRMDPPSWVIPHELMHVFQFHQRDGGQTVDGTWSEGHANYGRELWITYYRNLFPNDSGIDANYIHSAHMIVAHGRDYYLSWPFFLYLDENPDGLPDLGFGTMAKIWKQNLPGVYMYSTLENLTPVSNVKDIIGYFARRQLTFDYENQAAITNALNSQNPTVWRRFITTDLERRPDDTNWWRVPMEMAPMQGGYTIHELVPHGAGAGREVTVNFRGLPDPARGADWRAAFIVISDSGAERYSPLWNNGSNTVTLAANENRVYVSVAGTPNSVLFTGFDDLTYPYRSHGSKQRLHYELQVFGAAPRESNNGGTSGLVQHPNGGGWRSTTSTVDASAYIGPNARVLNNARIRGNARVEDFAVVRDSATVTNNAVVSGHALVMNSSIVRDNAKVRDWAVVSGSSVVGNFGRVLERAQVRGAAVTNWGTAKGCAIMDGGYVAGWGVVDGDFQAGRAVTNGFAFGHRPFEGVPNNWVRTAPMQQFANYEFGAAHQSMARDQIGVTDAYLVGSPAWRLSDNGRPGTLAFNGTNQYAVLDRSLVDVRDMTIAAWVRWNGGAADQPVWHFGSAATNRMYFTPDDGSGRARLILQRDGGTHVLDARAALAAGSWTHVVVTISGGAGRLYINGTLQDDRALPAAPEQLNPANTATATPHHYLGRGANTAQPFFEGSLDNVMFYSRALSDAEIAALNPANSAPTLAAISDFTAVAGAVVTITNVVADSNLPWQTLTFDLLSGPANAFLNPTNGMFQWQPALGDVATTNVVSIRVSDNGAPSLSATQTFNIVVTAPAAPQLGNPVVAKGELAFAVEGSAGLPYAVQTSTNLVDWLTLFSTNPPAAEFEIRTGIPESETLRYFRVLIDPNEGP